MELLQNFINEILNLGSQVFLPLVMIFVGLGVKMKFKDAFSSALTLGVAFVGMNTVVGFMLGFIQPIAESMVKNTGIQLYAIDIGWSPLASIAWTWPYAVLLFPIQIVINLVMLATNRTKTLNVDLWNVWNKVLTAVLVIGLTDNVLLALFVGAIQVVFELWNADLTQRQVYEITHIPGVSLPHSMALTGVIIHPLNKILEKIPGLNATVNAQSLRDRIGVFAENHIIGFILGIIIAFAGGYDWRVALQTGVSTAAALTLFPMVAKLFMQALSPIADAAGEFMKRRFPGKEFYIGLDWPFLAGSAELWVTTVLLIPVMLIFAITLPGNTVLPLAGIVNICAAVPLTIITGGNVLRMFIIGTVITPIYLYVGTLLAPTITQLAIDTGVYDTLGVAGGNMVSWASMEAPEFRFVFAKAANVVNGDYVGLLLLAGWGVLWFLYVKEFAKRNKKFAEIDRQS